MTAEVFLRDLLGKAGVTIGGSAPWDLQVREPRAFLLVPIDVISSAGLANPISRPASGARAIVTHR